MSDKPIIFSAAMVRALLDGRKTMTRRIVKVVPDAPAYSNVVHANPRHAAPYLDSYCSERKTPANPRGMSENWTWWTRDDRPGRQFKVGYVPGMRLWVRENYRLHRTLDSHKVYNGVTIWYGGGEARGEAGKLRPAIHMPRYLSRLTLEVTAVKVERLQEITPADAIAEGITPQANSQTIDCDTPNPRDDFRSLWDSIHGPEAWNANPWVVALTFKTHRINIDQMPKAEAA